MMRDLYFLKLRKDPRDLRTGFKQILADRPGQWGQGEGRSIRPASPAMGYGRLVSLENEIFLYKPDIENNFRASVKISVIEKDDFIYCMQ